MRKWSLISLFLIFSTTVLADDSKLDLKSFAQQYFDAMVASQAPNATTKELESYLALLTEDVGHSHLPYLMLKL
jgi:hypothetical protein